MIPPQPSARNSAYRATQLTCAATDREPPILMDHYHYCRLQQQQHVSFEFPVRYFLVDTLQELVQG